MSHNSVRCIFCKAKLDPAKENQNLDGGWAMVDHPVDSWPSAKAQGAAPTQALADAFNAGIRVSIKQPMCLRHHGIKKLVCQQNIPSMLSGIEGPDVPEEKLEAALVVVRSRKAYSGKGV